jgi:hypothetical protein
MAGQLTIDTLIAGSGVLATQNGMTGIAKAWVNWNGTLSGTITPRNSFNVTSVTKNGTGNFTVNFTTAMPNTNYSTVGTCALSNAIVAGNTDRGFTPQDYNTTSIRYVVTDGASGVDPLYCNVVVFSS